MSEAMKSILTIAECTVLWCMYPALVGIYEYIDKKKTERIDRLMARRRKQHKIECERAGRKLLVKDSIRKTLTNNDVKKQTIKYTGYFSGKEVEKALAEWGL